MTREELIVKLSELAPAAVFEEGGEWVNVVIASGEWKSFAQQLRSTPRLDFDFLFCVTCVDWKTHLSMVYHLTSTIHRHAVVVKSTLERANPEIETVCDIWRTADFHEREQYEMFGVKFLNHPDLRRLILEDDFQGFPLRKDYVDENMIEL